MKSLVSMCLLVLVLVEVVICCEGCLKQERQALIALNSQLANTLSWAHNTDCCEWEGVKCNTTTGRVVELKLSIPHPPEEKQFDEQLWQLHYSDFLIFKDLKILDLLNTPLSNCTRTDQGLKNLEVLYFDGNYMDNVMSVLSCLDGLSSLKSLSWLAESYIQLSNEAFQTVLETISSKMPHLEVLDISENQLTNEILPFLRGFKSLKELHLSRIGLDSDLHIQGLCAVLKNLEILDISSNNFNDTDIASALSGLFSLKSLNLEESGITPRSIRNISKLRSLEILDISGNNFSDTDIASALIGLSSLKSLNLEYSKLTLRSIHNISKLRSLEILNLAGNDLSSDILSPLNGLPRLKSLDLSFNRLSNIVSSLNGLPRLKSLDLSSNNLNGAVDITGLVTLTSLKILDFSQNKIVELVVQKGSKTLSRLDTLSLDSNMINGSSLQDSLEAFPSIRNLTLATNIFKGTILAEGFRGLSNLEYLTLDWSVNLKNEFFKSIGDLPSLKHLSVSYCFRGLNGTLPVGDWSKLKKLEKLDLSYNELVGQLPSSFVNLTSLRTLILTYNNFIGKIGPNFASFTSLEYLNFEGNQFEFPISFTPFANNSNLKFLYGNGNKVILDPPSTLKTWVPKFQLRMLQLSSITEANSIPLPKFLLYQYHLTYVDFTGCKLRGEFPNWILENNTKMETLILENCSFIGNFQLPSHPHFNMATIDVSNNAISGQMLINNISTILPNLVDLNMSRNAFHGSIPYELSHLSSLEALDLSDNQLSGEIPHELFGQLNSLKYLLLDRNILSGNIPSNIFNVSNIKCLDISNNNFMGKIPSQINTWFVELSMSNNHFEGSIPLELVEFERLTYLDLSQNKLSGCVPSVANFFANFIHLSNNNLSCLTRNMSGERSSSMTVLDLSNNDIVHGIHDLIHDLRDTGLTILLLKGNHFTGNIPKQICNLTNLNILDLSFNKFVGEIPSCLGKMRFENEDPDASRNEFNGFSAAMGWITYYRFGKERDNFTSKKRSETYTTNILVYMSGIDLSHNELNGSIPSELGNLTRIRALNLSNNFFTGKIPATFSNLVQVESLDLSFNMLSGQIPPQLTGLTFIEVFSVAHNNLSGATPEWKGQFGTFDESSYEGNKFLCGLPLPKSCNPSGQGPATLPNGLNNDEDNDSWVDMYVFRVSFAVAYTSMLLIIATVLYINPYWRRAWFYYIGLVGMNCYYFIEDNMCKLF